MTQRKACECVVSFTKKEWKCEYTSSLTKNGPPDQHILVAFNPHTAFYLRESFNLLRCHAHVIRMYANEPAYQKSYFTRLCAVEIFGAD